MIWLRKRLWWATVLVPLGWGVGGGAVGPLAETGEAVAETAEEAGDAAEDVTD